MVVFKMQRSANVSYQNTETILRHITKMEKIHQFDCSPNIIIVIKMRWVGYVTRRELRTVYVNLYEKCE